MTRNLLLILAFLHLPLLAAATISVQLPPVTSPEFLISDTVLPATGKSNIEFRFTGNAVTDVGTLWTYHDKHQPPSSFTPHDARAALNEGAWLTARHGRWQFTLGKGSREAYSGNQDAGQLWLDLHTSNPPARQLSPQITKEQLDTTWCGVGYTIPWQTRGMHGACRFGTRLMQIDSLGLGAAIGTVANNDYSGMVKLYTLTPGERGYGWCSDIQLTADAGPHWSFLLRDDGLAGQLVCRHVTVTDGFVTSPQIIQDADGFVHSIFGLSGAEWQHALTLNVKNTLDVGVTYRGPVVFTALVEHSEHENTPFFVLTWPCARTLSFSAGFSPTHGVGTLGINTRYLRCYLSADDWPSTSPRHLTVNLAVSPVVF